MKLLLQYGKERMPVIILLAVCMLVPLGFLQFYQVSLAVMLYGTLLCLLLVFGVGIWDVLHFVRRHRRLKRLKEDISFSMEYVPTASGLWEADYQELLQQLFLEKNRIAEEASDKYQNMMDYAVMWAHQIKTPIAAMRLLLQTEDMPCRQELQEELFQTEQYVETMLVYLKLDVVSQDLVLERCDLDSLLRQCIRKHAPWFIRKKLYMDFQETKKQVLTDEKWLSFIIEQILSNALKYTNQGGVTVYYDHSAETLVIKDTGIGIASEDLPRIFEKGFTGYNGRRNQKSTGIGLYLCSRAASKLGHSLSVVSKIGEGTTVLIGLERKMIQVKD